MFLDEKNSFEPVQEKTTLSEKERLITFFEQNHCPSCDMDVDIKGERRGDGFCSEDCYKEYEGGNKFAESDLVKARGEYNYRNGIDHSG